MKYAFISSGAAKLTIVRQCDLLDVSSSGYYDWRARQNRDQSEREQQRAVIDQAVKLAFDNNKQRYGSPRLCIDLNASGFAIAENTVAASMRRQSLVAKAGRKFKATTNSSHNLPVAPNLLEQDFSCNKVNEKWCGDITYLWTTEGWLYLAMVLDLYSRKVIGWSINDRMTKQLVCDAMQMALSNRSDYSGVIMHTDRGSQYCSKAFQNLLKANDVRASMSKRGDCYDNACAETFFHSMKVECVHGEEPMTKSQMRETVFEYIEIDYNNRRIHTAIGNVSPIDYEMQNAA